jgi:hypothetical protein
MPLVDPVLSKTIAGWMDKCYFAAVMRSRLVSTLTLAAICFLWLSCGGGSQAPTLSIQPPTATVSNNTELGLFGGVTLQAVLSNGQTPTNVQWSGGAPLIPVIPLSTGSAQANVGCSIQGPAGAQLTATVTATTQGLTASAKVTCVWN